VSESPKTQKVSQGVLEMLQTASKAYPEARWSAYQNVALDSDSCGHIQFLAIGPTNTYKHPPKHMPDTKAGLGWKYQFIGWIDLMTGEIKEEQWPKANS
jgi:hypothetical protein